LQKDRTVLGREPACDIVINDSLLGHTAARTVAAHPEQGWSLLCNGVIVFDDSGELLPDGHAVAPAARVAFYILAA